MNHGRLKCPNCHAELELSASATKAPSMQTVAAPPPSAEVGEEIGQLLESIDIDALDEKAAAFVTDMQARYDKYADSTRASDKQMAWLRKLANA